MLLKTLQWNIGGGFRREQNADPLADESYCKSDLDYFVSDISRYQPDICFLQEVHSNTDLSQPEYIANKCDLPYFCDKYYADSHIEKGQKLGLAILSKYPISSFNFEFFINPKFQKVSENGEIEFSHDKGVLTAVLQIEKEKLEVKTLHMVPFRTFGYSDLKSDLVKNIFSDVESKLSPTLSKYLLEGDFNIDSASIENYFPKLINTQVNEILQEHGTTPKNRKYEHILYNGLSFINTKVDNKVLADHFPIQTEFEL